MGLIQDVTDQFQAVHTLREDEARMDALLGSIDEVVTELSADGVILKLWTRNDELLVRPREELIGASFEQLLGKEVHTTWRPIFKRVMQTGASETLQYSSQSTSRLALVPIEHHCHPFRRREFPGRLRALA